VGQKPGERDLDCAWPRAWESRAPDRYDRVVAVLGGSLVAVVHEPRAGDQHRVVSEQLSDCGGPRADPPTNPKLGPGEQRDAGDARGVHAFHCHGRGRVDASVALPRHDVERSGRSHKPTSAAMEAGCTTRCKSQAGLVGDFGLLPLLTQDPRRDSETS